jgi:ribosomal protein S18 acetylase RimI-like enzyme
VPVQIKPATKRDLPQIAQLAGELVRQHYGFDAKRFLLVENPEAGYAWWFEKELANSRALICCAELDGRIVGYAYARLEERDWNALLDEHAALHDIFVDASVRRQGIGKQLLQVVLAELKQRGAPRVVLHTATQNVSAHQLFAAVGFRQTMLEMTREL